MNRRNFLKRLAAVAAGAVVVPTMVKRLPFRSNPVQARCFNFTPKGSCNTAAPQYRWMFDYLSSPYNFDPPSKPSKHPDYPLGTRYCSATGQIYRYVAVYKERIVLC